MNGFLTAASKRSAGRVIIFLCLAALLAGAGSPAAAAVTTNDGGQVDEAYNKLKAANGVLQKLQSERMALVNQLQALAQKKPEAPKPQAADSEKRSCQAALNEWQKQYDALQAKLADKNKDFQARHDQLGTHINSFKADLNGFKGAARTKASAGPALGAPANIAGYITPPANASLADQQNFMLIALAGLENVVFEYASRVSSLRQQAKDVRVQIVEMKEQAPGPDSPAAVQSEYKARLAQLENQLAELTDKQELARYDLQCKCQNYSQAVQTLANTQVQLNDEARKKIAELKQ